MNGWMERLIEALHNPWLFLGLLGQGLFFSRWIIQLYVSERRKESYVPLSFWYVSLVGASLTLGYAIQRADPIFVLGQGIGILNYGRNIMLIGKKERMPPRTP